MAVMSDISVTCLNKEFEKNQKLHKFDYIENNKVDDMYDDRDDKNWIEWKKNWKTRDQQAMEDYHNNVNIVSLDEVLETLKKRWITV